MAFEYTSLMGEVEQITSLPKPNHFKWRAEILAGGERIVPRKVMTVEIDGDYVGNYADEMFLELMMGAGQFAHRIYPYRDNLVLTLYRESVSEVSSIRSADSEIKSQQFRCILMDVNSAAMEGNSQIAQDERAMDMSSFKRVRVQLVDLAVEQVRLLTGGAIMKNKPPGDYLKLLLSLLSQKVEIDSEQAILGVDIFPPDNTEVYKQLTVEHSTPIFDLAELIQNRAGLYATGIGQYLHQRRWYIYPLFNHSRFDSALKTLTLVNVPPNRMAGLDRTYRKTPKQTIALVTGEVSHMDMGAQAFANEGNGVRFGDPMRMFKAFSVDTDNKASTLRDKLNNEIRTVEPKTGFNNVPMSTNRITSNKQVQLSRLAQRNGSMVVCKWENSDYESIYPGMPVLYMYEVGGVVCEAKGVVHAANTRVVSKAPGGFDGGYKTDTTLIVYINRKLDWVEEEL